MKLLLDYQNGNDLFNLYKRKFNIEYYIQHSEDKKGTKNQKLKILSFWHPIIDLYKYAIINKDRGLELNIQKYFIFPSFRFIKYADQIDQQTVLFPTEFYNSSFDIVATYIQTNEEDYYQKFETFVGLIYFSESYNEEHKQFYKQNTLEAIWRNITLLVEHNRGDKILRYWASAHQHFRFNFSYPKPEYDAENKEKQDSIERRNKIKNYRHLFLQFHFVLGAYLMHKKNYKTLREVWFFTQSQPPDYVLMPQTMDSIFRYYFYGIYQISDIF